MKRSSAILYLLLTSYRSTTTRLAIYERESGNLPSAAALLEQNVRLRRFALPADDTIGLAECYRRLGDDERARKHSEKARWLQLNRQN